MTDLSTYERRIREIFPELAIRSCNLNSDGLLNDVLIVNDDLVVRFAKHPYAFSHLRDEVRLLRLFKDYLTLPIPSAIYDADDVLAYRLIPGETLRRDILMRLSESDQQAVADQLAEFFKELHRIPVHQFEPGELPMADALMKRDGWLRVYGRIQEKVFPLLMPHIREWAVEHFESHLSDKSNFEYELRMVDTDIPPYHILFDRQRKRINGIIDFGCAGLGDPAIDFGVVLYNYGESLMERFYAIYPDAEQYLKRARFYAGAMELRWLLTGVEKENPWWFAVHTGSAKDIKF